ncbi:hypothetical protein AB0B20_00795 [Micromonospora sp. NPDC049151]|uniref:hypothetical protein n=1 Tax=Micromonospora sp. NPDC049151 TaxID=3155648 RepID=UPI0033E8CBFD
MAFGRWVLLALMALLGPLLWWSGVALTTSAAYAALPSGDARLPDLAAAYRSSAIVVMIVFVLLNLALVLIAVPSEREVRQGQGGTIVRAVVGTVLVTALVWFEYRFSPAGHDWSGDPDARSAGRDHLHPWHPAAGGSGSRCTLRWRPRSAYGPGSTGTAGGSWMPSGRGCRRSG